jgi:M6 family metalloprotease-like protein
MPSLKTAIILCYRPKVDPKTLSERGWYMSYFFSVKNSHAAYWLEQTQGQLTISGDVLGWFKYPEDPNRSKDQRQDILEVATSIALPNEDQFRKYDRYVVMLALNPKEPGDGGSSEFMRFGHVFSGMVALVQTDPSNGHAFDFIAHELGHQLGYNHSFGSASYKNAVWSAPGEYGHPYCIMSAQGYGGRDTTFTPTPLRDNANAYTRIAPRLNAAACVAKGHILLGEYDLRTNPGEATIRIHARDLWLNTRENKIQALRVTRSDGASFVFEYRRKTGNYDQGLSKDTVILNALHGGLGNIHGTFVQSCTLPWSEPNFGHFFISTLGFAAEIIEWSPNSESILLRLSPNLRSKTFDFSLHGSEMEILDSQVVASGVHDFVKGEEKCIIGSYPWTQTAIRQRMTLILSYKSPTRLNAEWHISGVNLTGSAGTIQISNIQCLLPQPIPRGIRTRRDVQLNYLILETPGQIVVRLENNPNDGDYELDFNVRVNVGLGSFTGGFPIRFTGEHVEFGNGFNEKRFSCLFIPHDKRLHIKTPVLPAGIWEHIARPKRPIVQKLLASLAVAKETDFAKAEIIESELAAFLQREDLPLLWFDFTSAENIQAIMDSETSNTLVQRTSEDV